MDAPAQVFCQAPTRAVPRAAGSRHVNFNSCKGCVMSSCIADLRTLFGRALMILLAVSLIGTTARADVTVGQPVDVTIKTIDGKTLGTKDLKGKVVLLDFWATWCPPCRAEVPHMVQTNAEYAPKGLQIIGVSLDDSVGEMKRFVEQNKMSWTHTLDGRGELSKQFKVNGIPCVFLFDPDMTLRWTGHPAQLDGALK
jgi:thiol-disulfide isomerase/thioredoxin